MTKTILIAGERVPVITACEIYGVPYTRVHWRAHYRLGPVSHAAAFLIHLGKSRGITPAEAARLIGAEVVQ